MGPYTLPAAVSDHQLLLVPACSAAAAAAARCGSAWLLLAVDSTTAHSEALHQCMATGACKWPMS
eukprot:COSAG01_NODE_803_length_13459_cov_9.995808_13_plen_65_part_00